MIQQRCRQAERRWKKDRLHISLEILRDSLAQYQKAVKEAKSQYLSDIISTNGHCPHVLFSTINSVVSPHNNPLSDATVSTCEDFLRFFVDKVMSVRALSSSSISPDQSATTPHVPVFDHFEPISLASLSDVVKHTKTTICPLDVFPTKLLKEVFSTVGPVLLVLMNTCLSSGCVPVSFKHAVVRPLLKKTHLDANILSNFRPVSLRKLFLYSYRHF